MEHDAKQPKTAGVLASTAAGGVLGVDAIGFCVAMATLVFSGSLISGLAPGMAVFLLSTFVIAATLQVFSGIKGALGMVQDTSISILAPAVAIAVMGVSGSGDAKFMTALAVLGVSALATGAVFQLVGAFKLGRVVRVLPYPVAAGFLASSGWLLAYAAILISIHAGDMGQIFTQVQDPDILISLLLAGGLALVLLVTMYLRPGVNGVLTVLILAIIAFYGVSALIGLPLDVARERGFLPLLPSAGEQISLSVDSLSLIDWGQVLVVGPTLAIVVIVNLVGMLLNTGGAELATQTEVDINSELRSTGGANLIIGLMGGIAGYITAGSTAVASQLGAKPQYVGLGFCLTVLLGFFFANQIVAAVPTFIAAGLLLFIGITMLIDWVWNTRTRMTRADWGIVLAILVATAIVGILTAVVAGLIFSLAAFAFSYARIPPIQHNAAAGSRSSPVDRHMHDGEVLRLNAARIQLFELQGYLFFGSVEDLIDAVRDRVKENTKPSYVILDLANVSGVDSAACSALEKLAERMQRYQVSLHMSAPSAETERVMRAWGMKLDGGDGFRLWDNTDAAIEFCENSLLAGEAQTATDAHEPESDWNSPRFAQLKSHMTQITLAKGDVLISAGEASQDIYFLKSGRLGVYITVQDGRKKRVRSMVDGAIIGELAYYLDLPRSADIVAERACEVFRLDMGKMEALAASEPVLSAELHKLLAQTLAEKVVRMNAYVSDR